jgi:membrane protease YdiL (CAAX protease family)
MSKEIATSSPEQDSGAPTVPQYSLPKILLMFAWPTAWFLFLIHVVTPLFFTPTPGEFLPTPIFLAVIVFGNGAELIVALVLLRREGYKLTISGLRDRLRLRWPGGRKKWGLAIAVLVIVFALSMASAPLSQALAAVPGFVPPAYWPPMSNPTAAVTTAAGMFPDVDLAGNVLFLVALFVVGLVFNIGGEELYYRGFLLPKMRGVFGKWDWVANGLGFWLKHYYQRWIYPSILAGCLGWAFLAGPLGSLWAASLFHWIGNFFMLFLILIPAVFGMG